MATNGTLNLGEIRIEALGHFFGGRRFDPSSEVAQVREQNGDLAQPAMPWVGLFQDLVTDLRSDELVERVLDSEQHVSRQHGSGMTQESRHSCCAGLRARQAPCRRGRVGQRRWSLTGELTARLLRQRSATPPPWTPSTT